MSAQTLLTSLEAAIQAFLDNGAIESYTVEIPGGGTRTATRAELGELQAMRAELLGEVSSAKAGGGVQYFRPGAA